MNDNERTRTVTWQDPVVSGKAARTMSGAAFLRAIAEGKLPPPPIANLMGFDIVEVGEGEVVFAVEPQEFHYNPIGVVHGGLAATLLDSAMGCAVQSTLPIGAGYTTLDIHVNLVRAITKDTGLMRCEGEVIHAGQRTATAQARLIDASGKLYAHATTTCMIFR